MNPDMSPAADATAPVAAGVLSLRGIRRAFGDNLVLDGIDLDVAPHEVVALVGASGSGKSTLLRTVNLLEPIDDGVILLGGADVSDPRVDADRVRARIGVVFQHYNLFPHLSVLDNVTLAARLVHRMPRAQAERRGLELLASIGLADFARAFPDRLSGGQQQRAAIVRAIATEPDLLLLDEVTSALDPELVGEVLALVRSLAESGTTIVMATHEMAFAREVADRVVFQHYNLFPHLTVLENVTLASRLVHRMPRADAERRALELLDSIGLAEQARAYPDRLSGGQQQRVAIVRAIATSPELLLLDEVTSALDPELVGEVLELVRSLAESGTTIVMATHEMTFAREVAHRVVFLDAGRIIEDSPAAEFFSSPREPRTREFLARFLPRG